MDFSFPKKNKGEGKSLLIQIKSNEFPLGAPFYQKQICRFVQAKFTKILVITWDLRDFKI